MASPALPAARTYSLRGRLLWLLLIAGALAALVLSSIAYYGASAAADEIFDYHMQQIALALRGGLPLGPSHQRLEHEVEEANFDFVVQVWTLYPMLASAFTAQAQLPRRAFRTSQLRARAIEFS